ncbi:hypothetical protein LTS02_017153 [Friedmanniomyces endolithicus]|nr:hypothetical protein LTS02_017153 [Friedmanniomyces endolithicus]KAK0861864.1 hypothetical protein LTR87_016803 [Friedmanniomyces endolithicus]KAK1051285.1 hypothetical protein LTR74_016858 [Friedmanniomyces endolithicus]
MIHTEYGKQQQQQGLYQNNVRLLTQPVGTLLLDYLVFVRPLYERFLRQSSPQALISPFLWEKNGKITVAIVKTKFAADALCFDLEDVDEDGEEIEADIKIMTEQRNHKTRTVNRAYANSTPSSATFANVYDGLVRKGLRASQLWQAFWGFDILFANRWIHILRTDRLDLFVQPISTCAADSACNATRRSVRKLRRVDASVHVPGKQTSRRRDRESHPTMDLIKYYSEYRVLCCRVCQIGLHPNHYAQHFYKFYVRAAPELASSASIHHFVNNVLLPLLPVSPIQPQTESVVFPPSGTAALGALNIFKGLGCSYCSWVGPDRKVASAHFNSHHASTRRSRGGSRPRAQGKLKEQIDREHYGDRPPWAVAYYQRFFGGGRGSNVFRVTVPAQEDCSPRTLKARSTGSRRREDSLLSDVLTELELLEERRSAQGQAIGTLGKLSGLAMAGTDTLVSLFAQHSTQPGSEARAPCLSCK